MLRVPPVMSLEQMLAMSQARIVALVSESGLPRAR
jgi:hypothetical protein